MNFMSDDRQNHLIKAAEATISKIGMGIDPTAALAKVAKDMELNAKEINLVSSSVNNARALASVQTDKPEERVKNFPLTNAETVVSELFPDAKEEKSQSSADREKQPDGNEIRKRVNMKVVEASYHDFTNYVFDPETQTSQFRASLKVASTKEAETQKFAFEDLRIQIEEAKVGFTVARDGAEVALSKTAQLFRRTDAPSFERFEKICRHAGVTEDLVDMVYVLGNLEAIGQKRASNIKEASVIRALPVEYNALQEIVRADNLWKQAADYLAAKEVLEQQLKEEEARFFQLKEAKGRGTDGGATFMELESEINPTEGWGSLDNFAPIGGSEGVVKAVTDTAGITGEGAEPPDQPLRFSQRQQIKNYGAREMVERLMQDPYIKGHDLPTIVDAYNRAMSVNPHFGEAELASYIRQDLATEGGVPLDLQLRASKRTQRMEV